MLLRPAFGSISRLIFVCFAAIALVSIASNALLGYRANERLVLEGIDRQLATAAQAVAQVVPGEWHERANVSEAEDFANSLKLTELADQSGLAFLYSFAWSPARGVYFTSTSATAQQIKSGTWMRHGTPYQARPEIVDLFKSDFPEPVSLVGSDAFGHFRSILMARTGPGGARYLVGADMYVDGLNRQLRRQLWGMLGAALGVFGVMAMCSVFLSKRIARPIIALQDALNALHSRDLTRSDASLRLPFEQLSAQHGDEIGRLGGAFGRLLERLEVAQAQLRSEISQRERLENQLEVTRKIQQLALPLPEELLAVGNLSLASFTRPAESVGGDYYDVMPQAGSLRVGIGDVTEHGLESGIFMLMMQTSARTLVEMGVRDPLVFLKTINATLCKNVRRLKTDRSATLAYVEFEPGRLLISGQHEDILLIKPDGTSRLIDTMDLGFPVGMIEEIEPMLNSCYVDVSDGDLVVLYTDGVTEAENALGKLFGVEALVAVACANRASSAEFIKDAIIANVMGHINGHTIYDDITLVVVKLDGMAEKKMRSTEVFI